MGRTNPTYRDALRRLEERWQSYRRALRRRDRPHFDRLWEQAAGHADAAGYHNRERNLDLLLFSVALAQERRIAELEAAVERTPAPGCDAAVGRTPALERNAAVERTPAPGHDAAVEGETEADGEAPGSG